MEQLLYMLGAVLNTVSRISHLILITREKDRKLCIYFWWAIIFIPSKKEEPESREIKLLPQSSPGPSSFSSRLYFRLISFIFPPDYLSHAQRTWLPSSLTQLPGESPARINTTIGYPSGLPNITKDSPTAVQTGVLNYSWLLVMSFKFELVYPERMLSQLPSSR